MEEYYYWRIEARISFDSKNTFAIDPGLDRKSIESVALPRLDSSSVIGGKGIQKLTKRSRNRTIYKKPREGSLSLSSPLLLDKGPRGSEFTTGASMIKFDDS